MNAVVSYEEFLEIVSQKKKPIREYIPVVLIKPENIIMLNKDGLLNIVFSYFDARTNEIQFFLVGYLNSKNTGFFVEKRKAKYNHYIALEMERLGHIYYSNNAFAHFLDDLKNASDDFTYVGDTELIFIKYENGRQCFDFTDIHRYNLSELFHSAEGKNDFMKFRRVSRFLELTIIDFRHYNNGNGSADELFDKINSNYFQL